MPAGTSPGTPGIPGVPAHRDAPGIPRRAEQEAWWQQDLRRLAAVVTAGWIVGLLVIGIGSRAAMFMLAAINPQAHGRLSDDGFVMGQFDPGATAGLVGFGAVVGILGGIILLLLRPLRLEHEQLSSIAMVVGPAVVASALLVHTGGIDFTLLEPTWLPIALFVGLALLASLLLVALGEAWLDPSSWFRHGSPWRAATALPVLALAPLWFLLVPLAGLRVAQQTSGTASDVVSHRAVRTAGQVLVGAIFVVALFDLLRDIIVLS